MRSILILSSLAVVAGCATEAPAAYSGSMDSGVPVITTKSIIALRRQVCHKESVVGTQFPQTICTDGDPDQANPVLQRNVEDLTRNDSIQQGIMNRAGGIYSR